MKRFLCSILSILILCCGYSGLCITANGTEIVMQNTATNGICGENAKWKYNSTSKTLIISGTGSIYDVNDNSTAPWFNYINSIETIAVDVGITKIGYGVFKNTPNVKNIIIHNTITEIRENAFLNCSKLINLYIVDLKNWCSIKFGNQYSNPAFYANKVYIDDQPVRNLVIPDNVTEISPYAFYNWDCLTTVDLGKNVTTIGVYAFELCSNLTTLYVRENIEQIKLSAFYGCVNLKKTHIENLSSWCNVKLSNIYSAPFYYGGKIHIDNKEITSLIIPDDVTNISENCFALCDGIKSVRFGKNTVSIGAYAFYNCSYLTTVSIPESVKKISLNAFANCNELQGVYISDLSSWCNISFYDSFSNPLRNGKKLYLNNELVTNLVIPDDVTEISAYAFFNCQNITNIDISKNVTKIDRNAFAYCKNISEIIIPDNVKEIGNFAFNACENLKRITILNPDCIIDIESEAIPKNAIVYAPRDSEAIKYAKNQQMQYVTLVCIETGKHNWITDISCENCLEGGTITSVCTYCYETRIEAFIPDEHSWDDGVSVREHCDEDGTTTYTCTVCGDTKTEVYPAGEHIWDKGIINKNDCETEGTIKYTCTVCRNTKTETIPAEEHSWYWVKTITPASCETEGLGQYKCKKCEKVQNRDIAPTSHVITTDALVLPTCTKTGLTEGKHCIRCQIVFVPQEIINALGHNEVIKKGVAPTCSKSGLTDRIHCSVCNEVLSEMRTIPRKSHEAKVVGIVKPTYFKKGYSSDMVCKYCKTVVSNGKATAKLKLKTPAVKYKGGKKKLTVKYTKVSGATGFQLQYKIGNKTVTKSYNTKKSVSKVIKNLDKGTYKVKIRAFVKSGSKKAYSKWTKVKSVKVKR